MSSNNTPTIVMIDCPVCDGDKKIVQQTIFIIEIPEKVPVAATNVILDKETGRKHTYRRDIRADEVKHFESRGFSIIWDTVPGRYKSKRFYIDTQELDRYDEAITRYGHGRLPGRVFQEHRNTYNLLTLVAKWEKKSGTEKKIAHGTRVIKCATCHGKGQVKTHLASTEELAALLK